MRKHIVIETSLDFSKENYYQKYYKLDTPDATEPNFYRQARSLSAFFHGNWRGNRPSWNHTDRRQFTCEYGMEEYFPPPKNLMLMGGYDTIVKDDTEKDGYKVVNDDSKKFSYKQHFNSLYEFFDYIGFDRSTKKYNTGERCMTWDHKNNRYK